MPAGLQHVADEIRGLAETSSPDACYYGLNDSGCSNDCMCSKRAFPTINGVDSLLPPPANVSIVAAEGETLPPQGYGQAQTV